MKIQIKVKSLAKLHDIFEYKEYETSAQTTEELITELISFNVKNFNRDRSISDYLLLSPDEMSALGKSGKISFGGKKANKTKVDSSVMINDAIYQYKDGLYKIINETKKREYVSLDEKLELNDNDVLVFIRLALISGRSF